MTEELPAEIAELRARLETAESNLTMAEDAYVAAKAEVTAAEQHASAAGSELDAADQAEAETRREYVATLRRHGYVQTADGPRPAHTVHS